MRDKIFILITVVLVVLFGIQILNNLPQRWNLFPAQMETGSKPAAGSGEEKEARYYRVIHE